MQWFIPSNAGNTTIQTHRWVYTGNPVSTTIQQTPVTLLSHTADPRMVSYSATATSGAVIKLWLNADPSAKPATLRSCDGHNMLDWLFTGVLVASVDVGSAIITIDVAWENV